MAEYEKRVCLVLGMHRSGTSLLTRAMPLLGVELGGNLLPPQEDNPEGFFEDVDVVALNERCLADVGASWHTVGFPASARGEGVQALRADAQRLISDRLARRSAWGFKDPRTLRTLPLWVQACDRLGVGVVPMVIFRDPMAVARSLRRRDRFPIDKGLLLWASYYLHAWPALRELDPCYVRYEDLVGRPIETLQRLASEAGLELAGDSAKRFASEFVRQDLDHGDGGGQSETVVWSTVRETFDAFCRLARDRHDEDARRELDRLHGRYSELEPMLVAVDKIYADMQLQATVALRNVYGRFADAVSARDIKLAVLEYTGLPAQNQLEATRQALTATEQRVAALLRSHSWRMTAPVRRASEWLQFARARLRAARGAGRLAAESPRDVTSESPVGSYADWVSRFDADSPDHLRRLRQAGESLSTKPLISVVMPVFNVAEAWLTRAIDSVLAQTYANWELCIVDDASTEAHIGPTLCRYAARDSRIKLKTRATNGHISVASNDGVSMTEGDFVAFLDHDDELAPAALYWIAREIVQKPEVLLIYSDEDKIDASGRRHDPYFKPDFNRDLLLGQNMVTHLAVYQRERLVQIGGFREGFEGSQDYDLVLRFTESLPDDAVAHVCRILYHWRAIPGSTALIGEAKSYAAVAGRKAVQEHLDRCGIDAQVVDAPNLRAGSTFQRVIYARPRDSKVSLIVPTRDGMDLLLRCMNSIARSPVKTEYEIIIVDNNSQEISTADYLAFLQVSDPRVRVLRYSKAFNFSAICNFAVEHANGDLVCLLNNDTEVISPGWLDELAAQAARPPVGAVGAKLLYTNGTIQHAGVVVGIGGTAAHIYRGFPSDHPGMAGRLQLAQNYSAVTGACLMVRRALYERVGGLDEVNFPVAFNDIDFCLRIDALGFRNVWTPYAVLYHHESATRGYEDTPEKKVRFDGEASCFQARWVEVIRNDRYYSPNLTLLAEDGALAFPPRVTG